MIAKIADEARLILVAVQFLTRIPVPSFADFETVWLDRAVKYFPLVGALVGALAAATLLVASMLLPSPLPALLAVATGVMATGAFHEDGLADTADGLGGGTTRERRLEIMKDSRIGTYGAVALGLVLALKVSALAALEPAIAAAALIAAHASARLAPVAMIALAPYGGDVESAKIKPLATRVRPGEVALAAVSAIGISLLLLPPVTTGISLVCAMVLAATLGCLAWRLIGGYTGDNLGAMEQLAEIGFLLAVVALTRS